MTTTEQLRQHKALLRQRARARRDALSAQQRAAWSSVIGARAIRMAEERKAHTLHVYLSVGSEVDTDPLIRAALARGMQVAVPIVVPGSSATPCARIETLDESAFARDLRGLRHPRVVVPVAVEFIDIAFVPLIAFGAPADGRLGIARLGQGGGYYDRFLAQLRAGALKVGLAFACQEVPAVPVEPHDVLLDAVITEAN